MTVLFVLLVAIVFFCIGAGLRARAGQKRARRIRQRHGLPPQLPGGSPRTVQPVAGSLDPTARGGSSCSCGRS